MLRRRRRHNQTTGDATGHRFARASCIDFYTSERDQLRADLVRVQAKAEAADEAHQKQRASAAQEIHRIAELMTKAEADRDTAR